MELLDFMLSFSTTETGCGGMAIVVVELLLLGANVFAESFALVLEAMTTTTTTTATNYDRQGTPTRTPTMILSKCVRKLSMSPVQPTTTALRVWWRNVQPCYLLETGGSGGVEINGRNHGPCSYTSLYTADKFVCCCLCY